MKELEKLRRLERVFRAELRSFVRYLVEEAAPTALDESDGVIQGLVEAWCRDSRANAERIERLFRDQGHVPAAGSWPLYSVALPDDKRR